MDKAKSICRLIILYFSLLLTMSPAAAASQGGLIDWQNWDDDLFERARQQKRMIILDLEAVWCHWCHVMEAKTYSHKDVAELINKHFIPVRVDADANPVIAARYGRWGWPATIVFTAEGNEIVKRRGYIPTIGMLSMLEAIIADPSPGPSVFFEPEAIATEAAALDAEYRRKLEDTFFDLYDGEFGGWGRIHKFVNSSATEYAFELGRIGRREHELMARLTLHQGLKLIDPEWGGVYQYSDQKDWLSPHFEKIMFYQAENLRLYSLAYARWENEAYLDAANSIIRYMDEFLLAPEQAYYTSQDADLNDEVDGHAFFPLNNVQRRALGMPRIDTNIYARENGWMIRALLAYYNATGDEAELRRAIAIADFIGRNRSIEDGGFSHGANDKHGPYLGDNLAMTQAFIALYQSTAERIWLDKASATLAFIQKHFENVDGGYNSATAEPASRGVFSKPIRQIEENAGLARISNLLSHYSGDTRHREVAEHAMRYLAAPQLSEIFIFQPDILLADYELGRDPVHVTVVGSKQDENAQKLFAAARNYAASYLRVDWWDAAEGALPNDNIVYPELERAALFACSDSACSQPMYDGDALNEAIANLYTEG